MPPTENEEDLELLDSPDEETPEPVKKAEEKKPDPAAEMREENARLRRENAEKDQDNAYWRGRNEKPAKAVEPEEEEPVKLTDDIVDALASGDTKRITKCFKELGFSSKAEVDEKITATRAAIAKESKVYEDYPQLRDPKSAFFKTAARHYNDLAEELGTTNQPKLIAIAAKLAAAEIGEDSGDDERPAPRRSKEDERVDRVTAQNGKGGRKVARSTESDELSEEQASIVSKFQSVGAAVTTEGYVKNARNGVRMAGVPARRQ